MSEYRIISDSNCDFTPALIQELGVQIIPMEFVMNGKVYHNYPDEHDMSSKEFYRRIRAGEMCTTNQINTATFLELFAPILEGGEDIFYMAFSSGLSGTYNSACMAAQELRARYPEREVVVVDTLAASMGEGLLVYTPCSRSAPAFRFMSSKNGWRTTATTWRTGSPWTTSTTSSAAAA